MNSTLSDIERTSGNLVQARRGDEWIAIQIAEEPPNPVIMPISDEDLGYDEWKREVQCFCVVSRKPEHKHLKFPEPPLQYPLPENWKPIPVRTDCVFWYHGKHIVLSATELFTLSLQGPAISEILQRLKQQGE